MLRHSRPLAPSEIAQAESSAAAHFAATVPMLLAWDASALDDLACRWEGTKGGIIRGEYLGRVTSIHQPQRAWLAFYLCLKGDQGLVRLRTSEREVRLDIQRGQARVSVNQTPLGWLRESDGAFLNEPGQVIGCYKRYQGWRWTMGNRSLSPRYAAVELGGRMIAEVNDALNWGAGSGSEDTRRQLIRMRTENLTDDETNWLIAMAGMEVYYDALRMRAAVNASPILRG